MNNLGRRLKSYCQVKNLKNKDLVPILGMTEQKIGTILNGKYQGSFEEFEEIVSKISDTTDDEYYYSTGKHLPKSKPEETQIPPHLAGFHEKMLKAMLDLTIELKGLKEEIKNLKEVSTHQGEILEHLKIPEP